MIKVNKLYPVNSFVELNCLYLFGIDKFSMFDIASLSTVPGWKTKVHRAMIDCFLESNIIHIRQLRIVTINENVSLLSPTPTQKGKFIAFFQNRYQASK